MIAKQSLRSMRIKRTLHSYHTAHPDLQACVMTRLCDSVGLVSPESATSAFRIRMNFGHVTAHGFSATFATWAEECTDYRTVCEKRR
jgi:hypothetical protein